MNLYDYSDDYYLKKYYTDNNDVPTQTVMREKMSKLADVYFKLMPPNVKVYAGLQPILSGPGKNLYISPENMLKRNVVLTPVKKEDVSNLGCSGIHMLQNKFLKSHQKTLKMKKQTSLDESDKKWLEIVKATCADSLKELSERAKTNNSVKLREALKQFEVLYISSINKLEEILNAPLAERMELFKEEIYIDKKSEYEKSVKQQATALYDRYEKKLQDQKTLLRTSFIEGLEKKRTETATKIHDINVEKHRTVDKLRKLIEYQNLACQVYVMLKERKHSNIESREIRFIHEQVTSKLTEELVQKEEEIKIIKGQKLQQQDLIDAWREKVHHVVKKFQEFVAFSLRTMPEYGEFFINTEKLMLLQMSSAIEEPNTTESIFEEEIEQEESLSCQPPTEPFVVFGDLKGENFKKEIRKENCPVNCVCPLLPVLMINKRCIYAECDNFEVFRDKIKAFIDGKRGDDVDFVKDQIFTDTEHLPYKKSLKSTMESSMTRMLKKEQRSEKPIRCECLCQLDACFCSPPHLSDISLPLYRQDPPPTPVRIPSGNRMTARDLVRHRREPTLETFTKSIVPKDCDCVNRSKKSLKEHLPPYMMRTSKYQSVVIPTYEPCTTAHLKNMVEKLRGRRSKRSKLLHTDINMEAATQHRDSVLSRHFCRIASEVESEKSVKPNQGLSKILEVFNVPPKFSLVGEPTSPQDSDYLHERRDSFAVKRAHSLRRLLISYPSLKSLIDVGDKEVKLK